MNANNPDQLRAEHYAAFEDARNLVERLSAAVLKNEQPKSWRATGSLQHANHTMREALFALGALSKEEIVAANL